MFTLYQIAFICFLTATIVVGFHYWIFYIKKYTTPAASIFVSVVSHLLIIIMYWILLDIKFKYYTVKAYLLWSKIITFKFAEEIYFQNLNMNVVEFFYYFISMGIMWVLCFSPIIFIIFIAWISLPVKYKFKCYQFLYLLILIITPYKIIFIDYILNKLIFLFCLSLYHYYNKNNIIPINTEPITYQEYKIRIFFLKIILRVILQKGKNFIACVLNKLKKYWIAWNIRYPEFWIYCIVIVILTIIISFCVYIILEFTSFMLEWYHFLSM